MFGPHVKRNHAQARAAITAHIAAARNEAKKGCDFEIKVISLFVADPQARKITLTPAEAKKLKEYLSETKLEAIAHASYTSMPWTGDPAAAAAVVAELEVCAAAGIAGLVIHLPSEAGMDVKNADVKDSKADVKDSRANIKADIKDSKADSRANTTATARVLKYLRRCRTETNVRLYLEMVAAKPARAAFNTADKIKELFTAIRAKTDPTLHWTGLCIDTAHLWSGGIDLSSYDKAREWLSELEAISAVIPPDRIMFHLNDSAYDLGDGRDKHAPLMNGKIWEDYKQAPQKSGLKAFIDYIQKYNCPAIFERTSGLDLDYAAVRELLM